jgi:hypothetical protein
MNKLKITELTDEVKNKEPEIAKGFDRGIDFTEIKNKLIDEYDNLNNNLDCLSEEDKAYIRKKRMIIHRIIYITTACISLRNGSRICESVNAIKIFIDKKKLKEPIIVKIAKSEATRYKKGTKEKFKTKVRYRKIYFPYDWISIKNINEFKFHLKNISNKRLQKRVLDYLLNHFDCNTHSLRYSWINHMIFHKKKNVEAISKIIGHITKNQILTYVQNKECDEILAESI